MNYQETINYIESLSWGLKNNNNERMIKLMAYFNNPQDHLTFIHIAGTNGKGSCAASLNSILTKANYKVGLFTSPHLISYEERFVVNNIKISKNTFTKLTTKIKEAANKLKLNLTVFEVLTAIGFLYFYEKKCDLVILEVGLGGRLDATNIIKNPLLSIIMNIGLDHTSILGNSKTKIAYEKAGIIKNNSKVLVYDNSSSIINVFKKEAKLKKSDLSVSNFNLIRIKKEGLNGQVFDYKDLKNVSINLLGKHQFYNAAVVIDACEILNREGLKISKSNIKQGLENVTWNARLSVLNDKPLFLLDGAHNPQCASSLALSLPRILKNRKAIVLCGVLKDKDYKKVIKMIAPFTKTFVCLTLNSSRALKKEELVKYINTLRLKAYKADSIKDGILKTFKMAKKDDVILAFGSLYLAGDILKEFSGVYKKYKKQYN